MAKIQESLNYRHSGRTYSCTPFSTVCNIKIGSAQNTTRTRHLVFSLHNAYLRNSAIAYDEFKKTVKGQAMLKAFSFFMSLVWEVFRNTKSDDFLVYLEWVKMADSENKYVGFRVHCYDIGRDDLSMVLNSMVNMNFNESQKNGRNILKNVMEHDCHS